HYYMSTDFLTHTPYYISNDTYIIHSIIFIVSSFIILFSFYIFFFFFFFFFYFSFFFFFFFFFQAEDGIRDRNVTGVQTCALPIYRCCIGMSPTETLGLQRSARSHRRVRLTAAHREDRAEAGFQDRDSKP